MDAAFVIKLSMNLFSIMDQKKTKEKFINPLFTISQLTGPFSKPYLNDCNCVIVYAREKMWMVSKKEKLMLMLMLSEHRKKTQLCLEFITWASYYCNSSILWAWEKWSRCKHFFIHYIKYSSYLNLMLCYILFVLNIT